MFVVVPFSFDGKIDKIKEIEHRFSLWLVRKVVPRIIFLLGSICCPLCKNNRRCVSSAVGCKQWGLRPFISSTCLRDKRRWLGVPFNSFTGLHWYHSLTRCCQIFQGLSSSSSISDSGNISLWVYSIRAFWKLAFESLQYFRLEEAALSSRGLAEMLEILFSCKTILLSI